MLKFKKFLGSTLRSSSGRKAGKSQKECVKNLTSNVSVNEEYKEAFRTNSFLEIRTKAEGQLGRTFCDRFSSSPSSSSSAVSFQIHFTDYLLEPRQNTINALMQESCFHRLLVKFFDSSSEACYVCESILKSIQQTRANHRIIKRVIKISKMIGDDNKSTDYCPDHEKIYSLIFSELSGFALLENPLCIINGTEFQCIHASNVDLLERLMSKRRRTKRKAEFFRFCKKAGACGLIISHSISMAALLIIALHSIVGIVAAPAVLGLCSLGLLRKKMKRKISKTDLLEKLGTQLDVAAKGMFILINDFNTLSRLAGRLNDEIDHRKTLAAMCIKSKNTELLKEAIKEFNGHEQRFLEQLQELEEHVYLCFNTINRSRRLVLEQIIGPPQALESNS